MMKQGNNHSSLLEKLAEAAANTTEKKKVSFDETVLEALKQANQPSLRDIIADVAKGKNVHKTAQWDSFSKPMPEPPMEGPDLGMEPELGAPEDTLDTEPVEPEGDVEAAKQSLAQALVDLCGTPEAACDCVNMLAGGADEMNGELPPEELGIGEEPMGEELGDEMLSAPMEAEIPAAPMEMPSPM